VSTLSGPAQFYATNVPVDGLFLAITDTSGVHAYAVVFGLLVVCGLGLPLPEDIPMAACGYLIWEGSMRTMPAFMVAFIGVLAGDSILYFIGRRLGPAVLERQRLFRERRVRRVRAYFRKYGPKFIFFARFVLGIRAAVFFTAGALRVPYRTFLLLDGLAALVSIPVWMALGYGLGHWYGTEMTAVLTQLAGYRHVLVIVISVLVLAFTVRWIWRVRKLARASASRASMP